MRRGLWLCLGLLEACLSPPVPRDHEEPALLGCSCCGLTSLLRGCHLSFLAWVLTSLVLGSRIQHQGLDTPSQGPPCHTVTAVLRDQDKVLLLAPAFSHGTNTGKFHHYPANMMLSFGPREGFPAWGSGPGSAVFGSSSLLDFAFSPPVALRRPMLELDLIFLARSVIFSSGHSTFWRILGATAARL